MPSSRDIEIIRFPGLVPYAEAMRLQRERRDAVEAGRVPNALFLLEHAPVITLGRRAHAENVLLGRDELAALGIELCETDRGGDVTYHGPGQLIAYPILDLHAWRLSINWYLRAIEEVLISLLAEYGLPGERVPGFTGVWVRGAKVAAIGVGIHNWVTFHGLALNVDPVMTHFQCIVPCGIADKPVTSLERLLATPREDNGLQPSVPTMCEVMDRFELCFSRFFHCRKGI